jgi:hypothetical protein
MPLPLSPPPPVPHLQAEAPADIPVEDPGHRPAAFEPGTVEVKFRTAFTSGSYGPVSLVDAFLSWTEFQLAVDGSVLSSGPFALGLGAEASYGQPWLRQLLSQAVVGVTTDTRLRWRLLETGVAGRVSFHYNALEILDPYGVLLAGPTLTRFRARVDTGEVSGEGRYASAGMRLGLGGGLAAATEDGFVGGLELRYLASARFQPGEDVVLFDESGDPVEVFEWTSAQRPSAGASWVFWVGVRF